MSLQGSLRQLGLADVLQTALQGRQGNLILRRGATRAVLHVATDQLHLVEPDPVDPDILLEGFVHRGLLPRPTLDAERAREPNPVLLLDALLERGLVPWHDVDAVLRGAAEDAILDLLTWQDGEFRFEEGEPPPERAGLVSRVGVDIGGMLLRAAQRLDEHNAIAEELGLEALLFIPLDAPPPVDYDGDPTPTVHTLLDGRRVIDEVAMLCGLTRFAVLRSVFACVRAGAARTPTPTELAQQAESRVEAGQLKVARGLLLQWASLAPTDEQPLLRLADLAKRRKSPEEQADALQALGHLVLREGRASEAQKVFRDLLQLRPGDETALASLRAAADSAGDTQQYRRSTLELARAALDADEAEKATELLEPLLQTSDAPVAARVLRARAYVRLKDRDAVVREAEAAADALGTRARRKEDKEAARFFRDAIATLAPERSDLLRRFRSLTERDRQRMKRVVLLGSLLAIAATAGIVFRPESAPRMLSRIEAAWAQGRADDAQRITALLADRHPDSPEADRAFELQRKFVVHKTPQIEDVLPPGERDELEGSVLAVQKAMPDFPDLTSRLRLGTLHQILERADAAVVQDRTLDRLQTDLLRALDRVERNVRARRDVIARSSLLATSSAVDVEILRTWLPKAEGFMKDGYSDDVDAGLEILAKLAAMHASDPIQSALRDLRNSNKLLAQSLEQYASDIQACRRMLTLREIEASYEYCRTDAVRLLTNGQLDDAATCYASLEALLARLETDEVLRPLVTEVTKRRIPQFLKERQSVLAEIQRGLAGAKAAEDAGDLQRAVEAYNALAEKFWFVRFENVIRLPVQIQSVPTAAHVYLNGREQGSTPLVMRYPWGTQNTVTVEKPGFRPETRLLGTKKVDPFPILLVSMQPMRRWTVPISPTVGTSPVPLGDGLVVCERSGRLSMLDGRDGHTLWARQVRSLEGTRYRPVVTRDEILLPLLDGTLYFLESKEGRVVSQIQTGRPAGDPTELEDVVLLPTLDGRLLGFRGERKAFEVPFGGRPTAGLVTAHGRAWAGLSDGAVLRIDRLGAAERIQLPGRDADVVGISAYDKGLLVAKGDGVLVALDTQGKVLWHADNLGDLAGQPAHAGDVAAVVDTRGRVLLFSIDAGSARGQVDAGGPTQGGLLGSDGLLVTQTQDGRLWMYDVQRGVERVNVPLKGDTHFPPVLLSPRLLAASVEGEQITILELPPAPQD